MEVDADAPEQPRNRGRAWSGSSAAILAVREDWEKAGTRSALPSLSPASGPSYWCTVLPITAARPPPPIKPALSAARPPAARERPPAAFQSLF